MATKQTVIPLDRQYKTLATGSQVKPVTQQYDESKGVAGRVDSIIGQDSALMQRAATRAKQDANKLGLRNSSMAVQAGQNAVLDAATPIATADASLYQNQMLKNQDALNQGNQFNAQMRTNVGLEGIKTGELGRQFDATMGLQNKQFAENQRQFNANMGLQGRQLAENQRQFNTTNTLEKQKLTQQDAQFKADQQNKITLAKMDADSRKELATIEAQFKTDIDGNDNISNAWGTMMQGISQIQNNPDLTPEAKKTLIANQVSGFQSFANFWKKLGSGTIDVSDLLKFGPDTGTTNTGNNGNTGGNAGGNSGGSGGGSGGPGNYYNFLPEYT